MADDELSRLRNVLAERDKLSTEQSAEIDRLKADSARFGKPRRSARISRMSSFRFMDLPAEMRVMVYERCLSIGLRHTELAPSGGQSPSACGDRESTVPDQSLRDQLRIRRLVCSTESCSTYGHDVALWKYTFRHLTSVSIAFDLRGLADGPLDLADTIRSAIDEIFVNNTAIDNFGDSWTVRAHEEVSNFTGQWVHLCEAVAVPALKKLEIDLANCYCPLGCCRLIFDATTIIRDTAFGHRLQRIDLAGVLSKEERREIIDILTDEINLLSLPLPRKIRFQKPRKRPACLMIDACDRDPDMEDDEVDLRAAFKDKQEKQKSRGGSHRVDGDRSKSQQ